MNTLLAGSSPSPRIQRNPPGHVGHMRNIQLAQCMQSFVVSYTYSKKLWQLDWSFMLCDGSLQQTTPTAPLPQSAVQGLRPSLRR